jgi:hypothetical protein
MINRHQSQPVRTGAIASFPNLTALNRGFSKVASMLPPFDSAEYRQRHGVNNGPPNVINIALRAFDEKDDMSESAWSEKGHRICERSQRSTRAPWSAASLDLDLPSQPIPCLFHPSRIRWALGVRNKQFVTSNLLWPSSLNSAASRTII